VVDKSIFVGIRIDNTQPWFAQHKRVVENLNYPKENLRIVYAIQDNVYAKTIARELKAFKESSGLNIEAFVDPCDRNLRTFGPNMGSVIFNDWKKIFKEDYFMLLDSDIVGMPPYAIKEMVRVDEPIVAPYIHIYGDGRFYQTWEYRLGGRMFSPTEVPGSGLLVPIEIETAGACMLVKGDVFKEIPFGDPYPTVTFCHNASTRGYRSVGLPYVIAMHENLGARGVYHRPYPQEFGNYPVDNVPYTFFSRVKPINREPMPLTPELSEYLKLCNTEYVAVSNRQAKAIFNDSKILQTEKTLKWTENITKFYNFYFNRDPLKLMYQYYFEPNPEWLEIETSTYCNFNCLMCENAHWDEPDKFMSLPQFKTIIDQFTDLKWIGFSGIGEAFLNPEHRDQMKYIKQKDPNIYIEYFDQFFLENKEVLQEWVDMSYDKVYVSFDGASKEQYEHQRPGSNYERVINNLLTLDKIKKDNNKHYPRLCFHYIINKDNISEAAKMVDMVADLDIDVWFIQYTKMLHSYPEIKDMQVDVPQTLVNEIQCRGKARNIETRFNVNTGNAKCPNYTCSAWTQPYIYVTGHMIPCCACNERNGRATQKLTAMGNIYENTLQEIWHGAKYKELRKKLATGQTMNCCEPCPIMNQRVSP
jgi:MoaA/NifB/PqqE/SkfB family radical SAM enzyme